MIDNRFINTKQRIIETEVLIIDEVSMVSKKNFEQAEYICRKIKNPAFYFGGIQVILTCYLLVEIILRTGLSDPSHYHFY